MMSFSLTIARRYLFGKKSTNAINVITGISVLGIAIGTAALILILSVFNGFEGLMRDYLDDFNPDLKIEPIEGKFFDLANMDMTAIRGLDGIDQLSVVMEEVALFEYQTRQQVGLIKGVDDQYLTVTTLDEAITEGDNRFSEQGDMPYATIGRGIYNNLNISLENQFTPLKIFLPNRRRKGPFDKDFTSRPVSVSGVFSIQNDRDNQYVITSYDLVSGLLDLRNQASAIEVKIAEGAEESQTRAQLEEILGQSFLVKTRYQQDESFLKIMNIEKWSSYLIFSFTLILIIFNVIGSLWMIVLDKKKDISILQSVGATKLMIRKIFVIEGCLISILGFGFGLAAAIVFYWLQKYVGIITVPDGFSISSYPITLEMLDVLIVFITVMILGFLASIPASVRASRVSAFVRVE